MVLFNPFGFDVEEEEKCRGFYCPLGFTQSPQPEGEQLKAVNM